MQIATWIIFEQEGGGGKWKRSLFMFLTAIRRFVNLWWVGNWNRARFSPISIVWTEQHFFLFPHLQIFKTCLFIALFYNGWHVCKRRGKERAECQTLQWLTHLSEYFFFSISLSWFSAFLAINSALICFWVRSLLPLLLLPPLWPPVLFPWCRGCCPSPALAYILSATAAAPRLPPPCW